jgi:predicted transcriptional regulator
MEILQFVLDNAPVTVRSVADHFAETKGLARTTVLTVMERLRRKGHLKREKGEAGYLYAPKTPKAEVQRGLIADFVDRALGGSISPFVAYLADRAVLDQREMDEVNRLLEKLKARHNDAGAPSDETDDSEGGKA